MKCPTEKKLDIATGLKELEDKKVLKHEFIDVGKKVVLRLTPFHKVDHFLNSPDRLPIFVKMCESVYGVSPLTFFEMSETMALKSAEKYDTIHKHENREYLWFFHCLDVVLTQATSGYQIKNKQAFLKNFLDAKEIDYPFNFIPVDIRYTDQKNKAELTKSLVVRENIEQDTEEELFRIANTYATILVQSGREEYLARVKALKPTELFSNRTIENFEIAELIAEDIKSGKDILHHLDDKKLAIAKSKNPLLEKQT
jgi:hypothetical protein